MRDIAQWKRTLIQRLTQETGLPVGNVRWLCDVEIGLVLLQDLAPNEPVAGVAAVISGYPHLWPVSQDWTVEQRHLLAVGRQLLQYYQGRQRWEDAVKEYLVVPERFRLFDFDQLSTPAKALETAVCPERSDIYRRALRETPQHVSRGGEFAQPGETVYYEREGQWLSIRIPHWVTPPQVPIASTWSGARTRRPAIDVSWDEIKATAAWMDEQKPGSRWLDRVNRIQISMPPQNLGDSRQLQVEGTTHVVGMVGSGKSTLMDVLAVWAARQGMHTTLVVGDVVDAISRATLFAELGLPAVPILGASDRGGHLQRLRRTLLLQKAPMGTMGIVDEDPRMQWVSPLCVLDGLVSEWPPIPMGQEPCDRLYATSHPTHLKAPVLCPFIGQCPAHEAENRMSEARIWVATPASLIYTRVPGHVTHQSMRMLESVCKNSDLVIVDEADRVQIQLDDVFGPADVLIGSDGGGWLDRLQIKTATRSGGRGYLNRETNRWGQAQRIAQQAADLIYALVNENRRLRSWIQQRDYFTAWSLFMQFNTDFFGEEEGGARTPENINQEIGYFLEDPLGEKHERELALLAQSIVSSAYSDEVRERSRAWLEKIAEWGGETGEGKDDLLAQGKLILAVAAAILDDRLKLLVDHWDVGEAAFGLESDGEWFFRRPPRDYQAIIPQAPMGNLFGFRFVSNESGKSPLLQFFRCAGTGRWLLTHLHELFEALDGQPGPPVLLLSATSWAPGSRSFHVCERPKGVLQAPAEEVQAISNSRFFFRPAVDASGRPVTVSGRYGDQRFRSLEQLLTDLAVPIKSGEPSRLERDLSARPGQRQRALLVVGSYQEARHAAMYLRGQSAWSGKVLTLIPDTEMFDRDERGPELVLSRSVVNQFGQRPEKVLVAPLLAIERGHNILTDAGEAAIGNVYFLIRPMPVPFSLSTAMQGINFWAMEQESREARITSVPLQSSTWESWRQFRVAATRRWHSLLKGASSYRTLTEEERRALCWTQLVFLWQTMGRAVRSGASVDVYFCDAAFAPETARGRVDTPETSLLLGLRTTLGEYLGLEARDRNPTDHTLARILYGPLAAALEHIKGIDS